MKQQKLYFFDKILNIIFLSLIPKSVKPNHLTIVRFLMIPFVIFYLCTNQYFIGLILFFIASFTDALDGALARTRNQITEWGKFYDPLADKLLICSVIVILIFKYINPYIALIIIILEIIILISALIKKKLKNYDIHSNFWGKIKMISQVIGIVFLLLSIILNYAPLQTISLGIFYLAISFAIISLFTYST